MLENQLDKFWNIEKIATDKPKSTDEIKCETHILNTVRRNETGRYVVRLPFRTSKKRLDESRIGALRRLSSLERTLNANVTLKDEYTQILEEYLKLGHMSVVETPDTIGYYMPHHAVIKESSISTKVRVVFDAKTSSGMSLNNMLLIGHTIQDKLFAHLICFRTYRIVLTADIEKMYRQVVLHQDDRKYQQILWHRNNKLETFQINRFTFGVSFSPFLTIRAIKELADDESHIHSRAAEIIKTQLYVDDLLTDAETVDKARTVR
ncbi:uncharacterized protein LOC116853591 [Odontomachus brunneus]|uniref:uncharacterized protein LOC116853591 n=1 Tax=Odontomachus brunneus TaxID=486640 RepID=UPI0013F2998F|nr:uncharacterized protein LOC116853591 [Odontomachus brunneus]